jgi:hypothetical protein
VFLDGDNIVFCLGEPAGLCSIREKRRSDLQKVLVDAKLSFSDDNCEIGVGVRIEESSCSGLVLVAFSAVKRGINTHRSWRKTRVWICRLPWRSLASLPYEGTPSKFKERSYIAEDIVLVASCRSL